MLLLACRIRRDIGSGRFTISELADFGFAQASFDKQADYLA